jgi:hypothetical protein
MFDIGRNYISWLKAYQEVGYKLVRMCDVWDEESPSIVLRHDIDAIRPKVIEQMALFEERMKLRSSWYIIVDPQYKYYEEYKGLFLDMQTDGHEIGLHVNSMEISHRPWKGRSYKEGFKQLVKDLKKIKDDGFNVLTATAHGIKWEDTNKDLLEELAAGSGVVASTFLFPDEDYILTDSRGILTVKMTWCLQKSYCMLTHPEWYDENLDTLIKEVRHQDEVTPEELSALT